MKYLKLLLLAIVVGSMAFSTVPTPSANSSGVANTEFVFDQERDVNSVVIIPAPGQEMTFTNRSSGELQTVTVKTVNDPLLRPWSCESSGGTVIGDTDTGKWCCYPGYGCIRIPSQ